MSILHNKLLFLSKCRISCQIVEVFLDFCGFNFADFWFNPIYTSILFSSTLVLLSNLHLSDFCFACFFMCPHINSVNPGMPVCKYDLRMFLAPGAASLPALVRFVGPGVQCTLLVLTYFCLHFMCTKLEFDQNISKYRPKNSKCGRAKPRSDIP